MNNRSKINNSDDSIETLHNTYIKKGLTKEDIEQLDFVYNNPNPNNNENN